MSIERIGKEQRAHELIAAVVSAIDLYWDNFLHPPENSLGITVRDVQADGSIIQETTTIQRFYDTAYFIKCQRSGLESLGGNCPVLNTPIDTTEYRMQPSLFERGVVNVRHIDVNGVGTNLDVTIDMLQENDPSAFVLLEHLQLNLLCLLAGHCKEAALLFDQLPTQVRQVFTEAYGEEVARQLWIAGMSDKDESSD